MESGSKLSGELAEVNVELDRINEQINKLNKRKRSLLDKKTTIERRIGERLASTSEDSSKWETDTYPWSTRCTEVLRESFKLTDFRPFQRSVINAVMSKEDTLVIMSTGGGKSLCYQLPAVLLKGVTLVVSPLISLIEDQLMQLSKLGIEAATLNQATVASESTRIQKALIDPNSSFRLLYVTPEKLAKSKRIMNRLEKCAEMGRLKVIAIDEVHCCSQWGHDFRPDFKFLNVLKRQFKGVPILGLTATATANVIDDVKQILGIPAAIVFRAGFNRPNLYYEVRVKPSSSEAMVDELAALIKKRFDRQSGIIYCFSRKECETLDNALRGKRIKSAHYHAYLDSEQRSRTHERWLNGDVNIIIATVAFGMGIDKPDVRFVIHHSIAKSMENYYQESGRSGRDGSQAECILYYRMGDLFRQSTMVCSERTGLTNLYSMLAYCTESKKCRRSLIADHFHEHFDEASCNRMCDLCANNDRNSQLTNVTTCWRTLLDIIKQQVNAASGDSKGRCTGAKLVELMTKRREVVGMAKDKLELVLVNLLLLEYLQEDFHYTPYSIISYVVVGPKSLVHDGDSSHRVEAWLPSAPNNTSIGAVPCKKPRLDSDSDDDVMIL